MDGKRDIPGSAPVGGCEYSGLFTVTELLALGYLSLHLGTICLLFTAARSLFRVNDNGFIFSGGNRMLVWFMQLANNRASSCIEDSKILAQCFR